MERKFKFQAVEYKKEIEKIENDSKFILKSFSLIWFAISFLLFGELIKGNFNSVFFENFTHSFTNFSLLNFFLIIIFFLLLKLIVRALFKLIKNISKSRLDFEEPKIAFLEKYYTLKESIFDCFFITLLLLSYLTSILLLDNEIVNNFIESFIIFLIAVIIFIYYYLIPLYIIIFRNKLIEKSLITKFIFLFNLTYFINLNIILLEIFYFFQYVNIELFISDLNLQTVFWFLILIVFLFWFLTFINFSTSNKVIGSKIKNLKDDLMEKFIDFEPL